MAIMMASAFLPDQYTIAKPAAALSTPHATTMSVSRTLRSDHQAQAGIQVITFDAKTSKEYVDKAYDVAWADLIKKSPTYGPQMKKLFSR